MAAQSSEGTCRVACRGFPGVLSLANAGNILLFVALFTILVPFRPLKLPRALAISFGVGGIDAARKMIEKKDKEEADDIEHV